MTAIFSTSKDDYNEAYKIWHHLSGFYVRGSTTF